MDIYYLGVHTEEVGGGGGMLIEKMSGRYLADVVVEDKLRRGRRRRQ